MRLSRPAFLVLCVMAMHASAGFAQEAAVPAPTTTLWNFLGIPQAVNKIVDGTVNRRGNFPRLERKPPRLGIADPKNLASKVPVLKKAAEIKAAEDLAPQKIKAIKYLAKMGCSECYGGVQEALMAAMEDCTEKVRLAAIEAISDVSRRQCESCSKTCCCSEEVSMLLAKIAYEKDDKCCWFEPAERVREAAAEALRACCPGRGPIGEEVVVEEEGDAPPPPPSTDDPTPPPPDAGATPPEDPTSGDDPQARVGDEDPTVTSRPASSRRARTATRPAAPETDGDVAVRILPAGSSSAKLSEPAPLFAPPPTMHKPQNTGSTVGKVVKVDPRTGTIHIAFGAHRPALGSVGQIRHQYALTSTNVGRVELVHLSPNGMALAKGVKGLRLDEVARGDRVAFGGSAHEHPARPNARRAKLQQPLEDGISPQQAAPATPFKLAAATGREASVEANAPAKVTPAKSSRRPASSRKAKPAPQAVTATQTSAVEPASAKQSPPTKIIRGQGEVKESTSEAPVLRFTLSQPENASEPSVNLRPVPSEPVEPAQQVVWIDDE